MSKKNILAKFCKQLALFFFLLSPFFTASAQSKSEDLYLPRKIVFPSEQMAEANVQANQKRLFDADKAGSIEIEYSSEKLNPKTVFEYGVAREIKDKYLTYFEILTTKTVPASSIKDIIDLTIPNVTEAEAKSTYVTYLKAYVQNDPDSEHFFVSKNFSIKPSASAFTQVKYVNLLQSTGKRFALKDGPTIYDPSKEKDPSVATSTSLEITFESNVETSVSPVIEFTKLRTGEFSHKFDLGEIKIKKGETYNKFTLPVFDYEPGVYIGKVNFNSEAIKSVVDFQYVVAGDMVTVGKVDYRVTPEGTVFSYSIFGTPIDLERLTKDSKPVDNKIYKVALSYKDGRKEVFEEERDVDFGKENFESVIPAKINKVDSIKIVVTSSKGEVVYEGVKEIDLLKQMPARSKWVVAFWYFGVLVLFALALFLLKQKKFKTIALSCLVLIAGYATVSFAWEPTGSYVIDYQNAGFANENVYEKPRLYFGENLTTQDYDYGEPLQFTFKFSYVYCSNTGSLVDVGFSTQGISAAFANRVSRSVTAATSDAFDNGGNHTIYRNTTSFVSATLGDLNYSNNYLFAYISHDISGGAVSDGWTKYQIPITVTPPPPTNLDAEALGTCSPDIRLTWTAPSGLTNIDGYRLYRSTSQNGTYSLVSTISKNATSYTDTLTSIVGGTFYYKLVSYKTSLNRESNPATAHYVYSSTCAAGNCKTPPHNTEVTSEPVATTANLCEIGLISTSQPLTSSVERNASGRNQTTYTWTCTGTNATQAATCSAGLQEVGVCAPETALSLFNENNPLEPSQMCSSGTTAAVQTTATGYIWKCLGSDSSRDANCTFNDKVALDGECGPINNSNVGSYPYTFAMGERCAFGEPNPVYSDNTYQWVCPGLNGGANSPVCKAYTGSRQAECVDYPQGISTLPTQNSAFCSIGTKGNFSDASSDEYTWTCTSEAGGIVKSCSAPKAGHGECGDTSYPVKSTGLCDVGSTIVGTPVDQGDYFDWQCKGTSSNPSFYATCRSYKGPACATGLTFGEQPTVTNTTLCAIGSPKSIDFDVVNNRYTWLCEKDTELSSLCSAGRLVVIPSIPGVSTKGRCNAAESNQNVVDVSITPSATGSLPITYQVFRSTTNTQDISSYTQIGTVTQSYGNQTIVFSDVNVTAATTYYYKVRATNIGGVSGYSTAVSGNALAICEADSSCGPATEQEMVYMPNISTPDLCTSSATPSDFALNGAETEFTWDCSIGSNVQHCAAPRADAGDAQCGDAENDIFSSSPSVSNPSLCNPGTAQNVTESGDSFSWDCVSADNSLTRTCSADKVCSGSCGGGNYPRCGSAEGDLMSAKPTEFGTPNLCSNGSVVSGSIGSVFGGYEWKCGVGGAKSTCFAAKEGYVPPGILCPTGPGTCPTSSGEVALRNPAAFPAIGNKGYTCSVYLTNVFESKNSNTFCELTGPNNSKIASFQADAAQAYYSFKISAQSTYKLTCWQQTDTGIKDPVTEVSKEVTCKINPSYVETSWIKRLLTKVGSLTASVMTGFTSFFSQK